MLEAHRVGPELEQEDVHACAGERGRRPPGGGAGTVTGGDEGRDAPARGHLVELSRDECRQLLATTQLGRVATCVPGEAPLVVPVNYVLDGDVVVFRSDDGEKIRGIRRGPASFQVDVIDPTHRRGWSVLVRGVAYEATEHEVRSLRLEPWVDGAKARWVRVVPGTVTGRRIELPPVTVDGRGYL